MLNKTPMVSIIIPVFNKVEFTRQCIEKIYANTQPGIEYEIIVVDNNSTDDTHVFMSQLAEYRPSLNYIKLNENYGFAKACNYGAFFAKGKTLVFLNNDTEPQQGWLQSAITRLNSDSKIGIVGSKLLYPDGTIQHCGIEFFENVNRDHQFWPLHRYLRANADLVEVNNPEEVTSVTGACLSISKKLFWAVDGFDESYGMYFEDTDLNFKVRKAGYKVFYEPESVVIHHEGISGDGREGIDALNKKAGDLFFKKWANDVFRIQLEKHLDYTEENIVVINENIYPQIDDLNLEDQRDIHVFTKLIGNLLTKINSIEKSYLHFGGAGDALLLLSTFYGESPEQTVISFANSIQSLKSFWKSFTNIKKIYLFPVPQNPILHMILRKHFHQSAKTLGMGVTPSESYFDEWNADINIFEKYGVKKSPEWAANFATKKVEKQIAIAPMGSMVGMVGSKKNVIDPRIWKQLIGYLVSKNYKPVILGVPSEAATYPCLENCTDKRSFSFEEQMQIIASSEFFIGADSWGKTFAALAGLPTFVFRPIYGEDLKNWKDNSDYVFLDPWNNITVVNNLIELKESIDKLSPQATRILWEGPQFVNHSLALVNRELCSCLVQMNYALSIVKTEKDNFRPMVKSKYGALNQCELKKLDKVDIHVRHHWPPNLTPPEQGRWVVIQPWEFGSLPAAWADVFSKQVDEMWVPSNYVKEIYLNAGVNPERVFVVPNGFDPEVFNPMVKAYKLKTKKKFKFLFVGGTIYRKGIDVLINAYTSCFTNNDDVCLVIKDFGGDSFYKNQTIKDRIQQIQKNKQTPEIEYINKILSEKELAGLYTACDLLVHPYRGEGFGLPILEAMGSALPVMVTNGGACLDFCNAQNSILINAEKKFFNEKKIDNLETVDFPWLYEPSLKDVKEKMFYAYNHPEELKELGVRAAEFSHDNFTWKHAAKIVDTRIGVLSKKTILRNDMNSNNVKGIEMQSQQSFQKLWGEFQLSIQSDDVAGAESIIDRLTAIYLQEEHQSILKLEDLLNLAGNIKLALGKLQEANEYFERQLNINPCSAGACVGLGEVFFQNEKYAEAKTMFEWAVKNDPGNHIAKNCLVKVNQQLGIAADDNTLSEPKTIDEQLEALFSETYSLYENKLYKEALAVLLELEKFVTSSSEEIHPDTLVSIINLSGYNYLGLNDIDNARESFERALNINPGSSSACAGLGEIYATFAMDTEAKTMYEWAVKNNPENQTAVSSLAKVNQRLGFSQNHNSLVLKNINPLRTIENKLDLVEELIDKDRNDEAEILLHEVLESEPTNVIALNNLSVIEIMNEHYEEAVKFISKVLAINPEDDIALENMNFIKEKLTSVLEQS
ncbi:MAG: glycosyltransferase [Ignavibacteria bacterium]|nr:glycosyltransferase [Ignavibacteria bacterium]